MKTKVSSLTAISCFCGVIAKNGLPNIRNLERDDRTTSYQGVSYSNSDTIRFSQKITFENDVSLNEIKDFFPLGGNDYPMSSDLTELLSKSNCPSVVRPDDYEVSQSVQEMIQLVGGYPSHAPQAAFWPWFEEVAVYQQQRRVFGNEPAMTKMPWLNLPNLWQNFTVKDVAEAVHDEFPGSLQEKLLVSLIKQGLKVDNNIIPKRSRKQFLHGPVMYSNLNTWAIDMVGPTNFAAKYYVGRARPEEIAWTIHCSLPENLNLFNCSSVTKLNVANPSVVPTTIVSLVRNMTLTSMQSFTGYPEGSPMHPSWPAMHSAASSLSLWLPIVAELTPEQWSQAKKTDLAVAMARTVAGVHYRDDNIAGLKMGQEIVARELPQYLAFKYGADPIKVRQKIASFRFDWKQEMNTLLSSA